jgi:microsomal epoxide hydrolase
VGQLAWIVEKFYEWAGCVATPEEAVNRDTLLTNVSVYWFTATAGPSAQLYFESSRTDADFVKTWGGPWPLQVPVGVAYFPKDAVRPIRRWAQALLPTLTHWREFDRGGHFAALEQPELFVADLREFIRSIR